MDPHPLLQPLDLATAPAGARAAGEAHARDVAPLTNMKRTLLHAPAAFDALMTWYPLRDAVRTFLGERATTLFAHAVSAETDCLICSTFFRRLLVESGEDPDALALSREEAELVAFARALAVTPHQVPERVAAPLRARLADAELVTLVAFGALMVATNVVNNVLAVPLDGYLEPYRRAAPPAGGRA